jgi:hypothetical protein
VVIQLRSLLESRLKREVRLNMLLILGHTRTV